MYRAFKDIAADVKGVLDETKVFKKVDIAAVSTGEQLIKRVASLAPVSAIICIGSGDFEQVGGVRQFTVAIIVVASPDATEASRAVDVWSLMESALVPFLPEKDDEGNLQWLTLNDVIYEPKGWMPVDSPLLRVPAFALELDAKEHL